MENIFAKGGKTKVKYDYIPQKAIDELSYTINVERSKEARESAEKRLQQ